MKFSYEAWESRQIFERKLMNPLFIVITGFLFLVGPALWLQNRFGDRADEFIFHCSIEQIFLIRAMVVGGLSFIFLGVGLLYVF